MKAADVISTLQARGVELWQEGSSLRYRAPTSTLTEHERAALKAHKGAILRALEPAVYQDATTQKTAVPPSCDPTRPPPPASADSFGQRELDAIKAGAGCWVWSGVLQQWLFWIRDEERRRKAIGKGIDPAVIWTLAELTGVVGLPAEDLRRVATIKRRFTGAIVPGAKPAQWRNAINPLEPVVVREGTSC